MTQIFLLLLAIALFFIFIRSQSQSKSNDYRSLTPREAASLMQSDTNIAILDVRTPEEFAGATGHLPHAILIPVRELSSRLDELNEMKKKTILVYCKTGHRSAAASRFLSQNGFTVVNLKGGIMQWLSDSLDVVK
ncbi:MAG TPA: rhodanese-like domain-containing protein [Bacteroidota bacterium]|nr:rhodanese-like domain-containing protein [Bacteroidota bacterium]